MGIAAPPRQRRITNLPARPTRRDPLYLTWDEYLEYEERSERRHEWVNDSGRRDDIDELGEVRPVQGYDENGEPALASSVHNQIVINLCSILIPLLRGTGVKPFSQAMEVRGTNGRGRYPDFLIVPDEPRFEDHPEGKELVLLDPLVLFEVLSDSTRSTDHGEKMDDYASIPTATDYLLVEQHEPRVEHHVRVADGWRPTVCEGPDAVVTLTRPTVELKLADVYERVFAA